MYGAPGVLSENVDSGQAVRTRIARCGVGRTVGSGLRRRLGQAARTRIARFGVGRAVGAYAEGRAPDAPTHSQFIDYWEEYNGIV